ncbi:MAG: TatD family hydrolase [Planctomycetota bacterium]
MRLVDIGVNLVSRQFESDRAAVVERARAHGVERMVLTGTTLDVSRVAADLAAADAGAWSTAGVHPHHASDWGHAAADAVEALCARDEVVAVGECGLDFNRNYSPREDQVRAFEAQLEIAARVGLPVFVHQRDAHDELLAMLGSAWPDLPRGAVVHCFTEGPDEAADYLDLGCSLGVTGWVCDERRGGALREAVRAIPADRLMLETDAPYLLPRTIEPKPDTRRNEPMHLPWVLREVAELRGEEPEAVAEAAWRSTHAFFGLGGG